MWPNVFVNEMDAFDLWYLKIFETMDKILKFIQHNGANLSFRLEPNEESWKETTGSPSFILARMQRSPWPFLQMQTKLMPAEMLNS